MITHVTQAIRNGEPPPQKARVQEWISYGTGGSRLSALPFIIRDEDEVSRELLHQRFRIDYDINWLLFSSMERGLCRIPLEAMSTTNSATMNEFDESDGGSYWERLNKRRIFLIDRELNSSLSDREISELEWMQARFTAYLDAIAPLPFAELEAFEAKIDEQQSAGNHCSDSPH